MTIVPGGIVCFFPSYEYEKLVFNIWEKNGLLDRIGNKKQVKINAFMYICIQYGVSIQEFSERNIYSGTC